MIGVQEQAAVELLEQRMDNTFGTFFDQEEAKTVGPIAKAYLNAAIRVVDNSGVVPQLMEWDRKRRKSNAGRKADIPYRAVLVLFLLHAQCGMGVTYNDLANTLDIRFTMEHFELLSIQDRPGDRGDWYVRLWAAANRMMKLIDPYPIARNRHMSAKKIERWHAKAETEKGQAKIQAKMARLDWLMEQLVHASVKLLPADILARAKGNLAIDATFVGTAGRPNPKGFTDKRRNADPFSGRYRRQGKHDGRGAKTDKAGYELETGVLVWNEPGGKGHFPSLVTSVSMHRPGELVGHGANLAASHRRLGFENFILLCDRAYNGERVENFHIPLRMMGVQPVFDYKKNTFGLQSTYEDVILVDGTWYVTYMPQSNIDAVKNYRNGLPDPETKQLLDKETLETASRRASNTG